MLLRKGKTRQLLEKSIDSALLAVEIYNKPRTSFRVETYITHMIIAWTKLFHAHFYHTIGDKYYYKENNKRKYKKIDGEKKAWELNHCINEYKKLSKAETENLKFFIKLRNKIEHRYVDRIELGIMIFGECQSLLYNYENTLVTLFGEEYSMNENLAYSLQFSRLRTKQQVESSNLLLTRDVTEIKEFIERFRGKISESTFNSQEFSIKLIQIPRISNTNRNDLAIEFINWSSLSKEDKDNYQKVNAIVKDKIVHREAVNTKRFKASQVIDCINEHSNVKMNHYDHKCLYYIFSIRPTSLENMDPEETNIAFCYYDIAHKDYLYTQEWIDFLINIISSKQLTKDEWKTLYKKNQKRDINTLDVLNY